MTANDCKHLIQRIALHDDLAAYRELFTGYHSALIHFSHSILHSKESAEEVVSDVFMKIWNLRHSLLNVENTHLYIYVITKNLSINRLHKNKREAFTFIDEVAAPFENLSFDPEQLLISAELHQRLHAAIDALPPKCRLIFKLIKEDGLKYKDVAELLQLSVKTVEAQMSIALKRVAAAIPFSFSHS